MVCGILRLAAVIEKFVGRIKNMMPYRYHVSLSEAFLQRVGRWQLPIFITDEYIFYFPL